MSDPHTDYATLSGDWEGYGPETADEPFGTPPERPYLTEAEINERLADELPDGLRFEFEPYCVPLDWRH